MVTSVGILKSKNQQLLVAFSRVGLYLLILVVSQVSFILQKSFVNWSLVAPFYLVICVALSTHILYIHFGEWFSERKKLYFLGFVLDAFFLSLLITFSGLNQSLFLFLYLVNILLAGLALQSRGALAIALFSSIFFTMASLFGPELKAMNYVFLLALNNIAFFSVAGLSGYLSEQLQFMGAELTRTGLSLRETQELNRAIVSHMPSGLLTFDSRGSVLQSNLSAQNILHLGDLRGLNAFQILPELQDKSSVRRDVIWKKDGEDSKIIQLSVASVYSPVIEGDLYIAQIEDLTPLRKLEYSVRQNEKMAAIGGLAAGIAHEIRNPLASISGSIEMLSQTTANEDDRKLMRIVLREISRLNGLITEFLDYSSPEKPPTDPVDLVSLVKEVVEGLKLDSKLRQDIIVRANLPEKAVILGRRDKLKQAFLNIVINAYQAMESVQMPTLTVAVEYTSAVWTVTITDNGCGMSDSTRRRMFEPFHTTKNKGTGLGLAVTHKILEGHAAEVFVESEQGVGTTFVLKFPAVNS